MDKAAFIKAGKSKPKKPSLAPHLIVTALAGTGKTTTLVEGLNNLLGRKTRITPSEQQAAVWDSIKLSKGATSIQFVAFNKGIAAELQNRVPAGVNACTMHSLGFRTVCQTFGLKGQKTVRDERVSEIICEIVGEDIRDFRRGNFETLRAVTRLVELCKMNLIGIPQVNEDHDGSDSPSLSVDSVSVDDLDALAGHYDVTLNGNRDRVYALVPQVLNRCLDVATDGYIDFADMIWLPVALNLAIPQNDLLLVDEAQDLNRCQQALAKKAGRRIILCGDINQAIYGFAGADAESMDRMRQELEATDAGCDVLPLTVTRRCGKAIVTEAQKIVPNFEAHETNGDGSIGNLCFKSDNAEDNFFNYVEDGDMLVCRVNAPLVSVCMRLIKKGIKANIQGRDIGQGLIATIKKMKAYDVPDLVEKLSDWQHYEVEKELRKRYPSDSKMIAINDRHDCLLCFTEGALSIDDVMANITRIFTDNRDSEGVRLSTIHKAKGLESDRVFLLEPEGSTVPHPMAKSKWQVKQEWNLRYVAITRAKDQLYFVS